MAKVMKKLFRPEKGKKVAGVCAGIANYFEIDVTLIRVVWAFLLIPGGVPGILPYIVCWIVIPKGK